ncbi:hypothetical protein, partial [Actinophytocola sp.]|uniref:hypothetical protein n=1 Tax=Actinophytocola sp. TaxID=1872138 RepID=UPI002D9A6F29|nr:hypothetical protein [Actinophytocola sp.]
MAGNLWEGRALAPDAIASTASGDIWLSPALIAVVPADDAWLGLRELHFAAIGEVGHKFQTDAGALLPDEAQAAYSSAVAAVLGQIGATDPAAGDRLLESLCGAAGLYEGFDGLEGPALSALLSAGRAGEPSQAMEEFHWLLSGMGMPEVPGGGYASTALLNPQTRDLGLLDGGRLGQLGNHPSTEQLWHHVEDLARDGVSSALGALGLNPRAAKDAGAAITAAAEGAALGANLGGLLGPAGSLMGGIVGGLIAFFGELFGDDEAQQRSAARDVASGDRVPVHSDLPLEKDGQRTVVSQTVTTTTT